jgi:hypothetical protein
VGNTGPLAKSAALRILDRLLEVPSVSTTVDAKGTEVQTL